MGEPVSVQAGWAIWSKRPGTHDDYAVLESSAGPLSKAEFSSVLAHFAPGNPSNETGTPASLPWVTLSSLGVAEKTYLGVSVQVRTEEVDATGRPISRTSYICLPYEDVACVTYEDVAREPLGYVDLADAMTKAQLPQPDGEPVPLAVRCLEPRKLAETIMGEFDPNTVATTAALLLSGPVTITGSNHPDPLAQTQIRLRFLDAVAALLPYGYRASFTAATWSDTGAGARFRIVFADRARDEASQVTWGRAARVPAGGPAAAYLEYLRRVLAKPAGDPEKRNELTAELAGLIRYLSRDTVPREFEHPEHAVASLQEFFRAEIVAESIDNGSAGLPEIRLLFSRGQDGQLSPGRRRKALELLIAAADTQDWRLISPVFDEIAGDKPEELLPAIAQACQSLAWSTAPKKLVGDYLRLVMPYGLADDLLARLVAPAGSAAGQLNGCGIAAGLIDEFVMGDPASYLKTQQALARNPAAGAALLARLCDSPDSPGRIGIAVEWLEPVLDRILPPFNAVLGDAPEQIHAAALNQLNQDGTQLTIRYLLWAAFYRKRLPLVLPALATWLTWEAVQRGALDRRFWGEVAMELTPADGEEAAWLDTVLLASANDPRSLFAGAFPPQQFAMYVDDAWRELVAGLGDQGLQADRVLTGSLIGFLGRHRWRRDQEQTLAVMELAKQLTAGGARPELRAVVLDPIEALRQLPRQAAPAQIAQACVRAHNEGFSPDQAGQALAESRLVTSGVQAADVLYQLHWALSGDRREISYQWQQEFARVLGDGRFGEQIAAELPSLIVGRAGDEITFHADLVSLAMASAREDEQPAFTDSGIDYLNSICSYIDEIARNAGKRQRRGMFSIRKTRTDADEEGAG